MKYKKTEHEKKQDGMAHYDCLEMDVRDEARKSFKRQPYQTVSMTYCMVKKYRIGGKADGKEDS